MSFQIKIYKDHIRTTPFRLGTGVDTRLFYKQLKEYVEMFKKGHSNLNNKSILVSVNGKETYRKRSRLEEAGIITIQDILNYLGIEPKIIMVDGKLVEDTTINLSEIYVLEVT